MENNQHSSFWQFSDQLRLQGSNLANLSLNDSIWSVNNSNSNANPYKKPENRRNFDIRVGSQIIDSKPDHINPIINNINHNNNNNINSGFDDGWKVPANLGGINLNLNLNGGFNKGIYSTSNSKPSPINNNNDINAPNQYYNNFNFKGSKIIDEQQGHGYGHGKLGKKNKDVKNKENNSLINNNIKDNKDLNGDGKSGVDKRFKTLPASEALPRNETVGGYIFVCNNDTMEENLKRQLFGLPPRYRDSVRQITPGLPLFLYNYSTHQLHGVYEAASFGGTNIDPTAWEDKKNPGESRFPAQVRVQNRKLCEPLDEDAFRPILHHYDGPKFRLELSVPEALSLLDIFAEDDA